MLVELLILLDRFEFLLDLAYVDVKLSLHRAQVALELVRKLLEAPDTVALLLLDLHGACERLPDTDYLLLVQAEVVFVEYVDFVVDAADQALDFEPLVGQLLYELLSLCHLLDILVAMPPDDLEHIINFLPDQLFAGLDLLFDLLQEDSVQLGKFLLQALLEVTHSGDDGPQ